MKHPVEIILLNHHHALVSYVLTLVSVAIFQTRTVLLTVIKILPMK